MADEVSVERVGRVLRVTINRPDKHNPLSRSVLAKLRAAFESHRNDEALACAIVTGAGDRYFAAGGDLRDLAEVRDEPDVRAMAEEARAALDAVRDFPLPVIARVNGDAIGGGAELAVACDFRVMRDGAHIGYVHGRLAITSAWGGATDLCTLVGPARALQMTGRCELVPAATALQWGLVDAIAPADALEAALQAFAAPFFEQTATALRGCKALARAARRGESYEALRALEQKYFVTTWTAPQHWLLVERFLAGSSLDGVDTGDLRRD